MAQVGARVESPLTLLREHLVTLAALLGGDEVTYAGRYVNLDHVAPRLAADRLRRSCSPVRPDRRRYGSAAALRTARSSPAARARTVSETRWPGSTRAGRRLPETTSHAVVVYVLAATGTDAQERLDRAQRESGEDLDPKTRAAGDADDIAQAVTRWTDAGATTVVLQPTSDDPDPEGFVRFVAEQVRPLLA